MYGCRFLFATDTPTVLIVPDGVPADTELLVPAGVCAPAAPVAPVPADLVVRLTPAVLLLRFRLRLPASVANG